MDGKFEQECTVEQIGRRCGRTGEIPLSEAPLNRLEAIATPKRTLQHPPRSSRPHPSYNLRVSPLDAETLA